MDETEADLRRRAESAMELRNREDFNNELSGRQTGRMARFLSEDQTPRGKQAREEERDRHVWQSLALQAQVQRFSERLDRLDRASIEALSEAERVVQSTEEQLEWVRAHAMRDDQGRLVYRTADGSAAYYDDASAIEGDELQRLVWTAGASTWEERKKVGDDYSRAIQNRSDIGEYRDRLHTIRERLGGDAPLGEDELSVLQANAEDMPDAVAEILSSAASTAPSGRPSPGPSSVDTQPIPPAPKR
jgi:hypothetical protein